MLAIPLSVTTSLCKRAKEPPPLACSELGQLEEVATGAELVILILPNSDVVESVLTDEALLNRLEAGTLVVDMSSSEPLRTRALAESLHTRAIRMIDAPVSGGVTGAEKGSLTVMVGGATTDLAIARSCLETFGRVIHAGSIGAGHAVKALNNLLSATHLWITSEAMLVGERFGVDAEVMLAVFNSSSGRSGSTENKWPNFILPGTFELWLWAPLDGEGHGNSRTTGGRSGSAKRPRLRGSRVVESRRRRTRHLPRPHRIVRWLEAEARPDGH